MVRTFGAFYQLVEGEEGSIEVSTDKLSLTIDNKGGAIREAFLNDFRTYDSLPLPVIQNHPNNRFSFEFLNGNKPLASSELFFTPSAKSLEVKGTDSATLVMRAAIDDERAIEQVYTFYGDRYDLGYEIRFLGMENILRTSTYYELDWTSYLPKTELSLTNMRQKTSIAYRMVNRVEKMTPSNEITEEVLKSSVDWVSFKSQFFSQILMADKDFRSGKVTMRTPESEEINRVMDASLKVDIARGAEISNKFQMFLGPNEYSTLSSYDRGLEEEMDLGWWFISFINIGTTYIFKFLEQYISNYGIIIIILAVLIRTMVLPLTFRSYKSMAKMRVLNATPEIKALDEKYKDDAQKLQMAKMGIYREMGVSMFGGCLPMLLSYPFLIALFFFFPQSVELRQQSFLWANDLSTYDSILSWDAQIPILSSIYGNHVSLFCLLMAISTMVYSYYQQKSQPNTGNAMFKYLPFIMPVFLLIFLNNYASGLSLYYLTSNLISISQTLLIRRTLNDEELLEQMRATSKAQKGKKGKKKSKGRLEKWMDSQQKKQQEILKQRQQAQGKSRSSRRKK
ncbi:MAG: membrane protein insertase YidC, partial [Bacteroidota bacterium]